MQAKLIMQPLLTVFASGAGASSPSHCGISRFTKAAEGNDGIAFRRLCVHFPQVVVHGPPMDGSLATPTTRGAATGQVMMGLVDGGDGGGLSGDGLVRKQAPQSWSSELLSSAWSSELLSNAWSSELLSNAWSSELLSSAWSSELLSSARSTNCYPAHGQRPEHLEREMLADLRSEIAFSEYATV
jgi:hypothetical protein